jgi:predicted AlkP superfamily phosphohydrolase/phosphomutase
MLMANIPKKVAVIGLDCALPHMIEKHIKEGKLPAFKKLIDEGTLADNCLAPFPTVTPPNWACIGTGAWDGTHGITDFHVHKPGTSPINENTEQAFSSERVKAEYIWDAADKAGKKCIVLNYPGSWPAKMKNGIMVGGGGMSPNEFRDGLPKLSARIQMCADQLVTNGVYPGGIKGKFESASGWENVPAAGNDPLEIKFTLLFPATKEKPAETTWYILALQSSGDSYNSVTLSPTKNYSDAFCTLSPGEWSKKIATNIKMPNGTEREVVFRCKLLELSDDAEDFRLLIGALGETSGWSQPAEVAKTLVSEEGTFAPQGGIFGLSVGWFDLDTYVEINEQYAQWMGDAASTLLGNYDWDLFFMHFHPTDWIYHVIMGEMDPNLNKDSASREKAWAAHLRIYEAADRMIAQILKVCDRDTLVVLVSDHGATADGTPFNPYDVLVPAGLCTLQAKQDTGPKSKTQAVSERVIGKGVGAHALIPDLNKSKALPQRELYIYVNLKGRDPGGIVDPKDYEDVQQQIIDALLSYVDPMTGKRPVSMALSKRDARIMGLYGDGIGDVVYALYPWFGGQHGPILPTAEWGIGSLKALMTLTGPGIKKGHRLQRTVWLPDLVPTICYLLDLPIPAQAEGAVIYQALKNPDFKIEEINKLKAALTRMETALQRGERQPWDKHECA